MKDVSACEERMGASSEGWLAHYNHLYLASHAAGPDASRRCCCRYTPLLLIDLRNNPPNSPGGRRAGREIGDTGPRLA